MLLAHLLHIRLDLSEELEESIVVEYLSKVYSQCLLLVKQRLRRDNPERRYIPESRWTLQRHTNLSWYVWMPEAITQLLLGRNYDGQPTQEEDEHHLPVLEALKEDWNSEKFSRVRRYQPPPLRQGEVSVIFSPCLQDRDV